MKVRNLLFMGALLLAGASAYAAELPNQRTHPQPAHAGSLQYGQVSYLYNIGAQKFFLGANNYDTRASVGEKGYKVWFTESVNQAGAVTIKDSVETQSAIKLVFADSNGQSWVDRNGQGDTLWTVVPQSGNAFRIQAGPGNPTYNAEDGQYYGAVKTAVDANTDTRLYWNLSADTAYVDWAVVSEAEYADYTAALEVYAAAASLYEQLQAAQEAGILDNVSAQIDVYNTPTATIDELNAAAQAVKEAIARHAEESTTADNPVDQTSYITNPSYDNNNNTGWSGTAPAFQSYTDAEFYNKTYDYRQVIKGLPKGVYAVTLQAFYRAGYSGASATNYINNTNYNAKLFAVGGDGDTLTANLINPVAEAIDAQGDEGTWSEITKADGTTGYIPNNMQGAEWFFNQGHCNNQLYFSVDGDSAIIGLRKTTTIDGDWTLFDNWGLKYYGKGTDAYTKWLNDMVAATPDFSNLTSETLVTTSMLNDYLSLRSTYLTASASTKSEIVSALNEINTAADSLTVNVSLWQQYENVIQRAKDEVTSKSDDEINSDEKFDLADYIDGNTPEGHDYDYVSITNDKSFTNDQLRAEIAWVEQMISDAKENGLVPGVEGNATNLIKNANFETTSGSETGWIINAASGGNVHYGGNNDNHCLEAWNNANFDVYQEVSAPVGVYTITVKGFYRYGRNNAWNDYVNGVADQYKNAVQLYVNDNTASFKNVFDEKVKYSGSHTGELYTWDADASAGGNCAVGIEGTDTLYWFPNGMSNAATAFRNGLYEAKSYGVVVNRGDKLRVGVKGSSNQGGDSWAIWDDFKMTYEGTNATVVAPLLTAKAAEVDSVIKATTAAGKTELETATADVASATETAAGSDGQAMFTLLAKLISDQAAIESSKLVFDTLKTQNQSLMNDLTNYADASEEAINTATDLYDRAAAILDGTTKVETSEARDLIAQMKDAAAKLRIPANYTPGQSGNFTSVIVNPSYESEGTNSFEGWTGPGYNFGNDDTQKQALLLEYYNKTFDLSQTINGLPNGNYTVTVNAFYRYGTTSEDYTHTQNGDENPNSFMYAVSGGDTTQVALQLLGTGARTNSGYNGATTIENTELVVPNDMVSSSTWFQDGYYLNTLDVNVTDGTLTIGIRKIANVGSDWVILDNWTLTYNGGGDEPTGINGITDNIGKIAGSKVYGIDGARQNGLRKGVNIVKFTDAQGKTAVRKIIVK